MRVCEELIIRSEINRRLGALNEARADIALARSKAEEIAYRYVIAVSERQRSKLLSEFGNDVEAARARHRSQEMLTRLTDAYRDPLIEFLTA